MHDYMTYLPSKCTPTAASPKEKEPPNYTAIALVDRLAEVDARVHGLIRAQHFLQEQLRSTASHGTGQAAAFDVPRTAHAWPLAETDEVTQEELGLYDVRADDVVVTEGRRGADFLHRFGLQGEAPDFSAAVEAL